METRTWLSCHYKFISAENITILSVSSDQNIYEKRQGFRKMILFIESLANIKCFGIIRARVFFSELHKTKSFLGIVNKIRYMKDKA